MSSDNESIHATLRPCVDPGEGLDQEGRGRVPELPLQTVKATQLILTSDPRTEEGGKEFDDDLMDKAVVKVTCCEAISCIIRPCS
jgi:hypothetical protein